MTKKGRDIKKMRIFESRNRIRIFGTNTNIRISVDILSNYLFILIVIDFNKKSGKKCTVDSEMFART